MQKMIVEIEADEGCELDEKAIDDVLVQIFMLESVGGVRKQNGDLVPTIPCRGKNIPVYSMDGIPEHLKNGPCLGEIRKNGS